MQKGMSGTKDMTWERIVCIIGAWVVFVSIAASYM